MSKYYVYGFSQQDIAKGKGVPMSVAFEIESIPFEPGTVLVYNADQRNLAEYPQYANYSVVEFVHERVLSVVTKTIDRAPIAQIDETEIPTSAGVLIRK